MSIGLPAVGGGFTAAAGGEFWSLEHLPGTDRPGAWEELLSLTHLPWTLRVPQQEQGCEYQAWVRRQWLDDLALVDCQCGPCSGMRARSQLAGTDDEYVVVLITRAGEESVAQQGTEARMHPGDAVVWGSTKPASFTVWKPLAKQSLLIPRAALEEVSGRNWTTGGVLLDGKAPAVRLLTGYLEALSDTLADLSPPSLSAARNATLELLVGSVRAGQRVDSSTFGPALQLSMERWIKQHLAEGDVTPTAIATAHAVSVRTVHRTFATHGKTVGEVVRTRRLARAREEVVDGKAAFTSIAQRWGFADSGHFSRAFKAHYGVSPREYRAGARDRSGTTAP